MASTGALDTYALTTLANANKYILDSTGDSSGSDTNIENIINRASDIIENYCGRKFSIRLYTKERHDGEGQEIIFFDNPPVLSVNLDNLAWSSTGKTVTRDDGGSFHTDGFSTGNAKVLVQDSQKNSGLLTLTAVATGGLTMTFSDTITADTADDDVIISECRSVWMDDDELDEDNYDVIEDYVYYPSGFSRGRKNVKITYYGGYSTIPDDLEQACLQVAKNVYDQNENVISEKLGDHWLTFVDSGSENIPEATKKILDSYRRMVL